MEGVEKSDYVYNVIIVVGTKNQKKKKPPPKCIRAGNYTVFPVFFYTATRVR